jgi:hypothetical protein
VIDGFLPDYMSSAETGRNDMPTQLHREIKWFQKEIALCEQTMRDIETGLAFGTSKERALAALRACLNSHRQSLAELEKKLAEES